MKKAIKLQINSPCAQNWQAMSPAEKGRFCQNCQKTVIDFSTWSEEKIKDFFQEHRGGICGRFQEGQLKTYGPQDPLWSYSPSFYTVAVASLLGMSTLTDSAAQASIHSPSPSYQTAAGKDSYHQVSDAIPKDSLPPYQIKGRVVDGKEALLGVNVILKGTMIGTTTNANGEFTLVLSELPTKQTILIFLI
ncbi:carboxypeptidase-like regulatory domain-containing protein [Rhodocytophaga rosea]|uniref:Carboxypeptidase-like regulatory domain-containing protein n=1 Tax=Rhodocytophaga rosea TaxID=2704465 RepID=A0A6C0GJ46_9BACT|nr:carboxypeptidase-like regulatory domain-containing protein [Rhodocytophaga rosea]QHT68056.1 carboxypeptidase-like regulatory domain-containing protein [Rhodocytophaga rosea]